MSDLFLAKLDQDFNNTRNSLKTLRDKIYNILGYLSQSLNQKRDLFYDAEAIWEELLAQGYSETEIEGAVSHIEKTSLKSPGQYWADEIPVYRAFTGEEIGQLSAKARGYLWKLKCQGVIDHALEDEIVQRALNLDRHAGLREIKTVAALTIFGYEHRAQKEEAIATKLLN